MSRRVPSGFCEGTSDGTGFSPCNSRKIRFLSLRPFNLSILIYAHARTRTRAHVKENGKNDGTTGQNRESPIMTRHLAVPSKNGDGT